MSVDVEPWWASDLVGQAHGPLDEGLPRKVRAILDLLDETNGKATFFVLGEIAERQPAIVEEIFERGHEIASHGYDHTSLHHLTPQQFRVREGRTARLLRALTGENPLGFRAPNYSLRPTTAWVYPILEELGYAYSSSVFPMRTFLYGWPNAPLRPFRPTGEKGADRARQGGGILEMPLAVYHRCGIKIPACGGGYLRYQPASFSIHMLKHIARERVPVFNLHPRDLFPSLHTGETGLLARMVLYGSLGNSMEKMRKITRTFRLRPLREFLP